MTRTPVAERTPTHATVPTSGGTIGPTVARALPTRPPSPTSLLGSAAPVAVFLLADAAWGLVPGMLASTAVAILAIWARRRQGQGTGWLGLALLAYVLLRGAAGALTGSHQVFFGLSVAASMTVAAAVLATSVTRAPLGAYLLPLLMGGRLRAETVEHPAYRRISAQVTAVWAMAELAMSGWEAWHLQHATAVEFVAARGLIGWPAMATIIFGCAFYARFRIEWIQGPSRQG